MKTVTFSYRFYYHELDEKDASAIKNDLVLYNKMLHKAYKYLSLKNKGVYIKSNEQEADSLKDTGLARYSSGHGLIYDKK